MATRPPLVHSRGVFSFESGEWADDDPWDSASDEETAPHRSTRKPGDPPLSYLSTRVPTSIPSTVHKTNNSSSSIAFSYTHIDASSSPKSEPPITSHTGWTMIRTSRDARTDAGERNVIGKDDAVNGDIIVDGDIVLDDSVMGSVNAAKQRQDQGYIRPDALEIVNDPLHGLQNRFNKRLDTQTRTTGLPEDNEESEKILRERSIRSNRRQKFIDCLSNQDVNIAELRKLAWAGIPNELRPISWQLLLGYLPLPTHLRSSTLTRKRGEYQSLVEVAFARDREGLDQQIWHQIEIDVPRTRPGVQLWMQAATQRCLERILYVWAIRHPASGYVQGINDLVTPFFQVFLSAYIDTDPEMLDPSLLPPQVLQAVEADSFWCLSRLLDGIQDNYIFAQPGIQRSVRRMAELVARIDAPLSAHLHHNNVEFMQFAFRWMNCLLMREISVENTIRMWDTYLAEGADAFSQFHLYVCSAFLVKWSEKLRQMDFQGIIMFLQSLPTQDWGDHEIEMLLSEAFVLNSIWHNAQSHFSGS